ncbi:MAG: ABC transporter substrate-binding protein [Herpetosiphonaceae bacterium]|nr:ABC transporter substrate-binding protein [Herpetosiphonaceae bacterium]
MDHVLSRWPLSVPFRGLLCCLTVLALAACGASAPTAVPTTPPDAVTLQLHWVHDYSSVGFYAAEKNGAFASQNLTVTIAGGGFSEQGTYIDATTQVANGNADFGIASADSIIQARAQGKPVVGIAAIFQRSPLAIISLEGSGINRPQDLPGHTIAVADGGATQLYNTLLSLHTIDPVSAPPTPRTNAGITPLINGNVDAMVAWAINEGVELREAGKTPNIMLMSDFGIDSYELVLLTSEKMIAEHPDVVKRFLQATLQGWNDVLKNPDPAVALVQDYNATLDLAGQQRRLQATLPLLTVPGTPFGAMQPEFWTFTHQMLLDQKALTQPIALERAYTLTFLNDLATP